MSVAFSDSKREVQHLFSQIEKTRVICRAYSVRMAKPGHDWYLNEWMASLGKRQADIVADLDWNPAKISLMLRGKQQYNRDAVNQLAEYLNLRPYELLMHPEDAMSMRRLLDTAVRIAAEERQPYRAEDESDSLGKRRSAN